jgi:hypothetical protein
VALWSPSSLLSTSSCNASMVLRRLTGSHSACRKATRFCTEFYGVDVTLVGAKSAACLLLCYLRETASLAVSQWGLVLAALSYVLFSFVPWALVLLTV